MVFSTPRILPFKDWDEWLYVKEGLYSNDPHWKQLSLQVISMWRLRGRIPHSADSTAQLMDIIAIDGERSTTELRLQYSMAIVRAVNGLVDPNQQGYFASSVLGIAERVGIPGWIVELRHDATHNQLPSIEVLRVAAQHLVEWYYGNYWELQAVLLNSLSEKCLPNSNNLGFNDNIKLKENEKSFHQLVSEGSSTFMVEIFLPVFLSATVLDNEIVNKLLDGNIEGFINQEFSKQVSLWESRLKKFLMKTNFFLHPYLLQLLENLVFLGSTKNLNEMVFLISKKWINLIFQIITETLEKQLSKGENKSIIEFNYNLLTSKDLIISIGQEISLIDNIEVPYKSSVLDVFEMMMRLYQCLEKKCQVLLKQQFNKYGGGIYEEIEVAEKSEIITESNVDEDEIESIEIEKSEIKEESNKSKKKRKRKNNIFTSNKKIDLVNNFKIWDNKVGSGVSKELIEINTNTINYSNYVKLPNFPNNSVVRCENYPLIPIGATSSSSFPGNNDLLELYQIEEID